MKELQGMKELQKKRREPVGPQVTSAAMGPMGVLTWVEDPN
jgi:hypothetical protein